MLEELRTVPFTEVFRRYNSDVEDNPDTGLSPGADFAVPGLDPQTGDADGRAGTIVFPVDDLGRVREDLEDASLGMPRDLDGDGAVDPFDHSSDYALLPVIVRIEWRGAGGDGRFELKTILKAW